MFCRRPRLRGRDRRGRLWAAEALARTGIGAITLIDMDDVCVTNTNRQIHALSGNVGLAKAEVMAERIRLINPECRVTVVDDFVTPENVAEYLGVGFSYVIDAIDSVRPKAALIAGVAATRCRWLLPAGRVVRLTQRRSRSRTWRRPSRIRWRPNCESG